MSIVRSEHPIDLVEEIAPRCYALSFRALLEEDEVVHVDVGVAGESGGESFASGGDESCLQLSSKEEKKSARKKKLSLAAF